MLWLGLWKWLRLGLGVGDGVGFTFMIENEVACLDAIFVVVSWDWGKG